MSSSGSINEEFMFSSVEQLLMNETDSEENNIITTNITEQQCQTRRFQGSPLPLSPAATDTLRYIQLVYYFSGMLIGLVLNVYLIALIVKCKKLHNISFYLVLQILVIDLVHCVILFPASITNILVNDWAFGDNLCPLIGLVILFARHTRNFLMLVLAIDRLCTVFLPFWFIRHRKQMMIPLSFGAWFIAFILVLIPVTGLLDCYDFQRFTWICLIGRGCKNQDACDLFRNFTVSLSFASVCVSLILYVILYCKARKLNKTVVPNISVSTSDTSVTENITGSRSDLTAEQAIRKSEKRATVTFLVLFLALFGVVFPSFIFFIIGPQILSSLKIQRPPSVFIILSIIFRSLFPSLIVIDPIALMRNTDVREVNSKILARIKAKLLKKH